MFSKPIRERIEIRNNFISNLKNESIKDAAKRILSYNEFFEKNVELKKYKLPELKEIIKNYKLPRTGNKGVLIQRIEKLFYDIKNAIIIQKCFRGWIVRYSFQLRGPAYKNKSICVNDTDFITLEPLLEIPDEQFYSYTDKNNFSYGFNISSLIQLIKNKGKINNPYNREKMDFQIINNIVSLNNIIQIIYPEYKDESLKVIIQRPIRNVSENRLINSNNNNNQNIYITRHLSNSYFHPSITNTTTMNHDLRIRYDIIVNKRTKPINTRIQEIFIDIDQLGNYTQSQWFMNLERRQLITYYRALYDIWNFRGQLSLEVKNIICPLFNPFTSIFARNIYNVDMTLEEVQLIAITAIENILYSCIDDEYRKIAALHILSALTMVSSPARNAMYWLYESVAF